MTLVLEECFILKQPCWGAYKVEGAGGILEDPWALPLSCWLVVDWLLVLLFGTAVGVHPLLYDSNLVDEPGGPR